MAKYPIKMLKDEEGTPFVPLVSTEALRTPEGETIEEKLEKKLEVSNIKAGTDISLSVDGNNITINNASKGVLIDNLDTETSGLGSLDAHQGKILKDMIPDVVNNLTTVSTDKALSAYQGYLLNHKVVPTGGTTGQVLKKSSNDDHALEWGDAADPNAISGDGSIKKIIECTYEEYKTLENTGALDSNTEYHIPEDSTNNVLESTIKQLILEDNQRKYYVGKIIMDTMNVNPATYLGFGTWVLWGSGRVPVGVDTSQTEFNTVEKTGGAKTHTHTYSHTHGVPGVAHIHSTGNHTLTVAEIPSHNHPDGGVFWKDGGFWVGTGNNTTLGFDGNTGNTGGGGAHNHGNTGSTIPSATTTNSQSTTNTSSTSNVQPYITCYMWKRTA